jgi:uncharacterized tellurite resistance protein B-like protein
MFETSDLYDIPDTAKVGFVKALLALADADGNVDLSESSFIQRVIESAGITDEQIFEGRSVLLGKIDLVDVLSDIKEEPVAKLLIQQLVLLAHVDGEYHENEKALILSTVEHFKLDLSWLTEVEAWACEGMTWLQKGRKLIS